MQSRRSIIGLLAAIPFVASCTSTGTIDPQKVIDAIKVACGIAIPAATVLTIFNAGVGMTAQAIVDIVCSGYHQALAGKTGLAAGTSVEYDVVVNGTKVHVVATKQ